MTMTLDGTAGMTAPQGAVYNGLQMATAQASTSGTSIDFTNIPVWAKRITVMFNGVSTNGTSRLQIQIGSGSFLTSTYASNASAVGSTANAAQSVGATTSGFALLGYAPAPTSLMSGTAILTNVSGNIWVCSGAIADTAANWGVSMFGGNVPLSGVLDRVRITTVNGTDTFDAGSVNIMYE